MSGMQLGWGHDLTKSLELLIKGLNSISHMAYGKNILVRKNQAHTAPNHAMEIHVIAQRECQNLWGFFFGRKDEK